MLLYTVNKCIISSLTHYIYFLFQRHQEFKKNPIYCKRVVCIGKENLRISADVDLLTEEGKILEGLTIPLYVLEDIELHKPVYLVVTDPNAFYEQADIYPSPFKEKNPMNTPEAVEGMNHCGSLTCGIPVSEANIGEAEQRLDINLPPSFRQCMKTVGQSLLFYYSLSDFIISQEFHEIFSGGLSWDLEALEYINEIAGEGADEAEDEEEREYVRRISSMLQFAQAGKAGSLLGTRDGGDYISVRKFSGLFERFLHGKRKRGSLC